MVTSTFPRNSVLCVARTHKVALSCVPSLTSDPLQAPCSFGVSLRVDQTQARLVFAPCGDTGSLLFPSPGSGGSRTPDAGARLVSRSTVSAPSGADLVFCSVGALVSVCQLGGGCLIQMSRRAKRVFLDSRLHSICMKSSTSALVN